MTKRFSLYFSAAFAFTCEFSSAAEPAAFKIDPHAAELLEEHCVECHEDGTEKGDIRLDNLAELSLDARLDLMNRMLEQVYLKQMPPAKKKTQPTEQQRTELGGWIWQELHSHNASKLEEKLRYPSYGNYVDHEKLFSGKITGAAFTPARRWLVSPQIFEQRVLDIFELEGKEREMSFYGVTNPFLLPDVSGVRDYDIGVLDGGSLLVMRGNANWIASKQIRPAQVKNGELGAADFPDPKDKWSPRQTPIEFETIILKKSPPTEDEVKAAIVRQFAGVLRRPPTEAESAKYVELSRIAIGLGGNTEGLRQILVAVLLESEFLYRIEQGEGTPDRDERKLLSPREAAYAISYAMGDRGPDAKLLEAAAQGRLATKEDFKREVLRLMADPTYYFGQVDPSVTGSHLTSLKVSHPKVVRFFRDFFGYPGATKVFKDVERGGGYYGNPDRGTLGTPGFLVNDADKIVDWCLKKDQDVFATMLTTDQYFVLQLDDEKKAAETVEKWRMVWEKFKGSDWKNDPEKVVNENAEFLDKTMGIKPGLEKRPNNHANTLTRCMTHFEFTFGRGNTPFPRFPWEHGNSLWHTPIYNLPGIPGRGGKYAEDQLLNYTVAQPFHLDNRKGILTHPAWLIAHSQNTATDPVRRGRWIREKLLAGRVPDIPITVDAVIPEDHTKTLRSRLEKVTESQDCIKCHQFMNPLGLPFEMYDDFGRFRKEESLESPETVVGKNGAFNIYKTLPVDPHGVLDSTGDPALDGNVISAMDMVGRLAKSTRTRQSIIRYAFRYYMGRNEMLSDSKTLIDADAAYVQSGGSFKAVIVSLLTSDSFIYRK
jgi:hypothetical protein